MYRTIAASYRNYRNYKKDLSKYNKCLSNNVKLIYYVPESLVEEVINNTKYNNIYNSENVFSDLTEFNEKYLVI